MLPKALNIVIGICSQKRLASIKKYSSVFYICWIKARIIMFYGFSAGIIIIIYYLFSHAHHFAKCALLITVREKDEICHTFHFKFGDIRYSLNKKDILLTQSIYFAYSDFSSSRYLTAL